MIIELKEYETTSISEEIITPSWGEYLWRIYDQGGGQLRVEEPGFRNEQSSLLKRALTAGSHRRATQPPKRALASSSPSYFRAAPP
jgi:hypothetical protein